MRDGNSEKSGPVEELTRKCNFEKIRDRIFTNEDIRSKYIVGCYFQVIGAPTNKQSTFPMIVLKAAAKVHDLGCIGLYREYAIAIQDEVGDSNGGKV